MKFPNVQRTPQLQRWICALLVLQATQTGYASHHVSMPQSSGKALGVIVRDVPFKSLAGQNLEYGVQVMDVAPNSVAKAAGISKDDIIMEIDQKPVYSVERLQWLVREAPEGSPIPVKFLRGGEVETLQITFPAVAESQGTGEAHAEATEPRMTPRAMPHPFMHGGQPGGRSFLGVQLQPMTRQLRAAFGAPTDEGVLVAGLVEGAPATQAGLAVGDVIVRMDRKTITDVADVHRVLAYFDPEDEIEVEIIRNKESKSLTARLGSKPVHMCHSRRHSCPHGHPH